MVDVEDTVAAVRGLAEEGLADGARLAIRGGSAGGWTVLSALTGSDAFACGASYFGVAELLQFAEDTHDFESRYLDGLIGPLPEARDLYETRAPLNNVDGLSCPVLLLQGLDDPIVPPSQAELFRDALVAKGLPHGYRVYEGESHGFRKAATIVDATEAELSFYGQVLGFDPPATCRCSTSSAREPAPAAGRGGRARLGAGAGAGGRPDRGDGRVPARRGRGRAHATCRRASNVLRAFTQPFADVRVLIVGQDPYPTPGHPIGLSFAVERDVRPVPRSLQNIYTRAAHRPRHRSARARRPHLVDAARGAAAQPVPDRGARCVGVAPRQGLGGRHRPGDPRSGRPRHAAGGDPVGPRRADAAADARATRR